MSAAVAQERFVAFEIEIGFEVEHVDQRQLVPPSDLEIVEVVRRRDLDRAGALLGIGIFVRDDGNAPPDQRQDGVPPDQVAVAPVIGVHGNGGVAEHGLGPRRCNRDESAVASFDGIPEMPELTLDLHLLHFQVRNGGKQLGVPVDQPLVLVDEAGAVELHEDLEHRAREASIHGEALARPVAGGAEPLELGGDGAARFRLPGPDLFQELLAPERAPARLLALHQLALDHHLGGDAGVVGPGLPKHVAPAHALESGEHVLEGIVERMAHMQ